MRKIGIIGGMGQHAGFDLATKIANNTLVSVDQDHVPVVVVSLPNAIPSRTQYLQSGGTSPDPKPGIRESLALLIEAQATVVGVACNTAHAPEILSPIRQAAAAETIQFVSIIENCVEAIKRLGDADVVGVLATGATIEAGLYQSALRDAGIEPVVSTDSTRELVTEAIKNREFGIKSVANPPTDRAVQICKQAVVELGEKGARSVILGCTELPLALPYPEYHGIQLIDPTEELARALIRLYDPAKLAPII